MSGWTGFAWAGAVLLAAGVPVPAIAQPVTAVTVTTPPYDPCPYTSACGQAADGERSRLGNLPPGRTTVYRSAPAQSEVARAIVMQQLAARIGQPPAAVAALVLPRDDEVRNWTGLPPRGEFRATDTAEVFAKYWIFSWIYTTGTQPDMVTPTMQSAVKAQARRIFASDKVLSTLSENQRQALSETMIRVQAGHMRQLIAAGGDMEKVRGVVASTRDIFQQQFGLDVTTLALHPDQGFVAGDR